MLNKDGKRELAYVAKVLDIAPIMGADKVEDATVYGWHTMVPKGKFKVGDYGVFIEVDSKLPNIPAFEFMAPKHFKVKTQKYTFGGQNKDGFYSQGILIDPAELGYTTCETGIIDMNTGVLHNAGDPTIMFMTAELGIEHIVDDADRKRKNKEPKTDYQRVRNYLGKKCAKQPYKFLCSFGLGQKLITKIFLKEMEENRKKKRFPEGFEGLSPTDQERIEVLPYSTLLTHSWIETEKCDGSSATYLLERKPRGKFEFYVVSRRVRQFSDTENYHMTANGVKTNVYLDMAEKYGIEAKLKDYLRHNPKDNFVAIQGEICGPKIQSNPHNLSEHHLFVFHVITPSMGGKWSFYDIVDFCDNLELEHVPVTNWNYELPPTLEEFKKHAEGYYDPTVLGGNEPMPREGYVYYNVDNPSDSFKNVSREYLARHR